MSPWSALLGVSAAIAVASAVMAAVNMRLLRRPDARRLDAAGDSRDGITRSAAVSGDSPPVDAVHAALVSICVPARNEAANIEACLRGLLAQRGASVEILVYDDHSNDGTGAIAARMGSEDPRVRIVPTQPLPDGWNGKQHACQRLGEAAGGAWLLFTDADVRFRAGAVAAALDEATRRNADLISAFPRQITGSWLERLVVPLIHFILLSYLPLAIMRRTTRPAASAGCGQFLLVRRDMWHQAGGHAAFRASMHDGIMLPRAVRTAGGRTDLFDGTEVVECRMYRDFASCWRGFAKNAYEGLGSVPALLFFSVIHLVGHILPWLAIAVALTSTRVEIPLILAMVAIVAAYAERIMLAARFRQSWLGVALHPIGVALMTAIQWHSFVLHVAGRREWRGRVHASLRDAPRSGMISGHG